MNRDLHRLDEDALGIVAPSSKRETDLLYLDYHVYSSVTTRIQPLDQTRFTGNHVGALLLLNGLAYAHETNSLDTVGTEVCTTIRIPGTVGSTCEPNG